MIRFLTVRRVTLLAPLPFAASFLPYTPVRHAPSGRPLHGPSPIAAVLEPNGPTYQNVGLQRVDPAGSVLGLTENNALTYHATGSKCIDLFFDVTPRISEDELNELLEEAWDENPLLTLKVIFQLGDPRFGKGDRRNFYKCLLWLYQLHHPTLLKNLHHLKRFSCYKAMLDLLVLAARGPDALDDKRTKSGRGRTRSPDKRQFHIDLFFASLPEDSAPEFTSQNALNDAGRWKNAELREMFVKFIHARDQDESRLAASERRRKRAVLLEEAQELYSTDSKFQQLYDRVADVFAEDLKAERTRYLDGKNISGLVAKWAPSPKLSHDRQTNICQGIIDRLYGSEFSGRRKEDQNETYKGFLASLKVYIQQFFRAFENPSKKPDSTDRGSLDIRHVYFKEYLSTLRRAAEIPESFIGRGEWNLVNYKRMPSLCRLHYGQMYRRHDQERYDEYLEAAKQQVEKGKRSTMVSAGTLLPHVICERAERDNNDELGLQWLRIVQDVKESGKLPSALAICDVSGSMIGEPLSVAVALSLLVADTSEGPWHGKAITFSRNPQLVTVPKATVDNLACRVSFMRGIDWGFNTDFQKVFDLILDHAKERNLPQGAMPSILFCFSDMEFDQAHAGNWKTDLELIRGKYEKANYAMPHIVFWNLRSSSSKPSSSSEPGVAYLSGFSAGLMKSFLQFRLEEFNPSTQLAAMLKRYDLLSLASEDQ